MKHAALLFATLISLSACIPVFEDEKKPEPLTFDAVPMSQQPMNFADIMCCYDCTV